MTFNYIVTIHNSEKHLKKVLKALFKVKSPDSKVYCVIDGCTDKSQEIVELFDCQKIVTSGVRETLAINAALLRVPQTDDSYNFILQDDVVLLDKETENKISILYKKFPNLGVVGMRHGSNLLPDTLTNNLAASETDLIQNSWQPKMKNVGQMKDGYVTERQVVYKSPICISGKTVQMLGGYDVRFAPIAHDDTEYCIRAYKAGLKNVVLSLKLDQPIKWGGTRRHSNQPPTKMLHIEHMDLLRKLYPEDIKHLSNNHPSLEQIKIW